MASGTPGNTGFSFSTALGSQAPGASPFSFGTTTAPPTSTTPATTTGASLFTAAATSSQPATGLSAGFLATPASSATPAFNFSAAIQTTATTTGTGFSSNFQLPTATPAPAAAAPALQFGGPTKPLGAASEPVKPAAPALQSSFAFTAKPAAAASLFTPATTNTTTTAAAAIAAAIAATTTAAPASCFPTLMTGQTAAPSTTTTTTLGVALAAATPIPAPTTIPAAAAPAVAPVAAVSTPAFLTTATSTSSAAIAPATIGAAPAGLSVAGLEEKVNKWMSELREQEERLMRQAAHVNAWDQLLQQGHDQVQQLRLTLNNVKTDQSRLQAELDFIQGQQQELEQLIEPLEAAAASTTPAQHQGDRQRENMHLVAQNLDSQLRQITDDLCKVIEHLNSTNSGSRASDPVNTVARVLSAHMDTLKWVDQNSALLSQKIDDISRSSDNKRRA
ncbi:Nuclear pore glycoprotein p62 [Chionoecetes opilio]|uniref:Nuclear pore glycoprotein p62 n=1 Tax=Chionoecetes opilio TaxID=41210 RepID=A0A8J5CC29_CHIOP|nr:Nuclear pore glycoprotein p62 [Chionoecetes opilio]